MAVSDSLFKLIKSLNKTEKGYFKKFSSMHKKGERNNYMKLFDVIDRQEVYDESKIVILLKKEGFVSHLSVIKNYLYTLILKSLESYHSSVNMELNKELNHVEILFNKEQYKECEKIISQAKKQAIKYDKQIHLLQILSWESSLARKQNYLEISENEIVANYKETSNTIEKYNNVNEYNYLWSLTWIKKDKKGRLNVSELNEIKQIANHPLFKDESNALSYDALYRFYSFQTVYQYFCNNYEEAYKNAQKFVTFMEKYPHK